MWFILWHAERNALLLRCESMQIVETEEREKKKNCSRNSNLCLERMDDDNSLRYFFVLFHFSSTLIRKCHFKGRRLLQGGWITDDSFTDGAVAVFGVDRLTCGCYHWSNSV